MPRTLKIAAVQMDANPARPSQRLARAESLVTNAADSGAHLVVLPELFNTGYTYADSNHYFAEPLHGPTVNWLRDMAAYLNIHLAGSLLLLDRADVYNSLLLFSPDERMWRYDKKYPCGWERGYFRPGRGLTIAHTDLGRIGMLICWDVGHLNLWRQYAGQIDLMLISSCPLDITNPTYHFPNGDQVTMDHMGPLVAPLKGIGRRVFGDMINEQTAWLGVPTVNTVGCGHIETDLPNGFGSLLSMVPAAPWLLKYLPQANRMRLSCNFVQGCKVVNAGGQVLVELSQAEGETFTIAEVTLADRPPQPAGPQPPSPLPFISYLTSDTILPLLSTPTYRRGLRRVWGKHMAPVEPAAKRRLALLGICLAIVLLAVWLLSRPPAKTWDASATKN
ncbi:MAG: carbon-nitrogen hydrolase family protein [Anaerolineae bacterium]|nr:carbon-nitrogen hydrolase family protein [Anaerolineae bacterium]